MREEVYEELLQIKAPWFVEKVEFALKKKRVDVFISHEDETKFPCPKCNGLCSVYDHTSPRSFRHLDTMQYQTILHCQIPRIECAEHGILQVKTSWAEPKSRFTRHFETLAIDVLKSMSTKAGCELLGISWDEAHAIKQRAVLRGLTRRPTSTFRRLGVDEVSFRKGHKYLTIVTDLDEKRVIFIGRNRKKETLDAFYGALSADQINAIEAVAMDMWPAYISSTMEYVPHAEKKIVFDRFHIIKHMNDAVNDVRKKEHRALLKIGDGTLKGARYAVLYGEENVPEKYEDVLADLRDANLKTSRAWAIKELLRKLWTYNRLGWAKKLWQEWYDWAIRSRLEPVKKVARMLKKNLGQIMNFFKHPISTSTNEGMNLRIQNIKRKAYGYRNEENLRSAVLFEIGGLNLYP